jgi:putative ABC transport system permease protein
MLNSISKHGFRVLNRQKGYLAINVIGLSIGIACSVIIALFIIHELKFDQFNTKIDRIYRLEVSGIIGDRELKYAVTSSPVGPTMLREIPEVEDFVRLNSIGEPTIKYQDKKYTEKNIFEADSSFFNIFSINLVKGNAKTALKETHTLVISQSAANKFFGTEDPMDKMIQVGRDKVLYKITGVMEDMPETSHITANIITSFVTNPASADNNWGNSNFATYILLKPNTNPRQVESKMPALLMKYMSEMAFSSLGISIEEFITKYKYSVTLQPLKTLHFTPDIIQITVSKPASNPKYLYIFGSVAILIIVIAVINYMNLSTAQASQRAKEVGIKKVSGSSKRMLVSQFLAESILLSFISLIIAIIIIENTLPYFSNLLENRLHLNLFTNWYTIPALVVLSLTVGLLAGSYPAFFLSSFSPSVVLKGKLSNSMKHGRLRSVLVILQFSISIMLIAGTVIMVRQIRYMMHSDLGFNKEQLLVIPHAEAMNDHVRAFKEAMLKIPEVSRFSASTDVPAHNESGRTYVVEGRKGDAMEFRNNYVDYDFFDTYGIKLSSGRLFHESFGSEDKSCILNESAVKQQNLTNPLATRLVDNYEKLSVIGVVKDFNFESLQTRINPYIFRFKGDSNNYGYFSLRLTASASSKTIRQIEKVWDDFVTDDPFQYFFMDEEFARKYNEERQNAQLSVIFSILAIIIASLGLFGLTSFTIEQRTKEIGIRKTMGSSMTGIFYIITREFILLIIISTLISWPLIYFVAKNWLQNYYYRITLSAIDFLPGFIISLIITLLTISYKTYRTAKMNPVDALRYE